MPVAVAVSATVPLPHLATAAPVGADGTSISVAVTDVLVAEKHPVAAMESNAKYVVVDEILGVVKLFPLPNNVPSVESEYHLMVPVPVADKSTAPVPHFATLVPKGADGTSFTVAVTAVLSEIHPVTVLESNA
jgi:hypothetical protein